MTRWFALGLLLVGGLSLEAQSRVELFQTEGRSVPSRPNSFGGGMVQAPLFQIAAQPPPAVAVPLKAPGQQPVPPGNQLPQPQRRTLRSAMIPVGPVKLDLSGDPLPAGALARYGSTRLRHGPEPMGLGFSPDGKMLGSIAPTEDGIRLWDPNTGKELYRLNSPANHAAFGRDGSIVVVEDTRCKVWIPAANSLRDLPEKTLAESVQALAVHPDCRSFAVGFQHKIVLIDLQTGKQLREFKCPNEQTPLRLAYSPDGRWLAGAGQKTGVWLWDIRTGKRVRTYRSEFDFPEFTFNGEGSQLAIAAEQFRIFSTDSEELIENYNPAELVLQNPRFSKDGMWIYGISAEGNCYRINSSSGEFQEFGEGPDENLHAPLAISPEGAYGAAVDSGGAIRVWDTKTGKEPEIDRLPILSDPGFSKDGKTICCITGEGRIHSFEAGTGKRIKVVDLPVQENSPLWLSPDGRRAIAGAGGEEFELQVFDVETKRIVHKIVLQINGIVPNIEFCASDPSRMAAFGSGVVEVINLNTGKLTRRITIGKSEDMQPVQGSISPDGRLVAVTTRPLSIWEVATGKKRFEIPAIVNAGGVVFSPDGRYLAGWNTTGNIVVFDARLGTIVRRMQNAVTNEVIPPVTFSRDGKRLAAGDGDGGITVWDLTTGETIHNLDRHNGYVTGLAFSPDGTRLASTSQDGTVLVWEVAGQVVGKAADFAAVGLDEAFRLLTSTDAIQAQRGMEFLYRRPGEAIKLCGERIAIPTGTPAEKITKLIADLGSEDYRDRHAATKDLEAIGAEAFESLNNVAEKSTNPEVRKLAGEIIKRLEASALKGDELRSFRAVELLENIGTPDARALLVKWAAGPKGHRMTNEAFTALTRMKNHQPGVTP